MPPAELRHLLYKLVVRFKTLGVTSLLTLESGSLSSMESVTERALSPIADNLLMLRYAETERSPRADLDRGEDSRQRPRPGHALRHHRSGRPADRAAGRRGSMSTVSPPESVGHRLARLCGDLPAVRELRGRREDLRYRPRPHQQSAPIAQRDCHRRGRRAWPDGRLAFREPERRADGRGQVARADRVRLFRRPFLGRRCRSSRASRPDTPAPTGDGAGRRRGEQVHRHTAGGRPTSGLWRDSAGRRRLARQGGSSSSSPPSRTSSPWPSTAAPSGTS